MSWWRLGKGWWKSTGNGVSCSFSVGKNLVVFYLIRNPPLQTSLPVRITLIVFFFRMTFTTPKLTGHFWEPTGMALGPLRYVWMWRIILAFIIAFTLTYIFSTLIFLWNQICFQRAWKRSLKCKAGTNCLNIKDTNKRTILFPRNRKLKLVKSLMALVFDAT